MRCRDNLKINRIKIKQSVENFSFDNHNNLCNTDLLLLSLKGAGGQSTIDQDIFQQLFPLFTLDSKHPVL